MTLYGILNGRILKPERIRKAFPKRAIAAHVDRN